MQRILTPRGSLAYAAGRSTSSLSQPRSGCEIEQGDGRVTA